MEQVLDSPAQAPHVAKYAGFWIRVAAYIIDYIVVTIGYYVIGGILAVFGLGFLDFKEMSSTDFEPGPGFIMGMMLFGLIMMACIVLYYCIMESSEKQATLGKMAVGIKVGKPNGERISFANAIGRYFAKILSTMILLIGYIMIGFDDRKQGLHDKLANTIVYYS